MYNSRVLQLGPIHPETHAHILGVTHIPSCAHGVEHTAVGAKRTLIHVNYLGEKLLLVSESLDKNST